MTNNNNNNRAVGVGDATTIAERHFKEEEEEYEVLTFFVVSLESPTTNLVCSLAVLWRRVMVIVI